MRLAKALFVIVAIINLYAQVIGDQYINQFTKPVLMPILIYLIFLNAKGFVNLPRLLLALALIFAWVGDMLLLNQANEIFFLGGLASFLVMQILYSIVFFKTNRSASLPKKSLTIPFGIGLIAISYLFYQYAGDMWITISTYALSILTMMIFAINRQEGTSRISYLMTTVGAFLFVISDSLIGVNKFITEIPQAPFLIMLTYIPAQYLIMTGIMAHDKH